MPHTKIRIVVTAEPLQEGRDAAKLANLRPDAWLWHVQLRDGRTYVRWRGQAEFLIAEDGRKIVAHRLSRGSEESMRVYLLGQVLSFAMLALGIEPVHANVVSIGDRAVAFAGPPGAGKTTLSAALIAAGHALLSDDLLVLQPNADGYLAQPGPPRLKLEPAAAKLLLQDLGAGAKMNRLATKRVYELPSASCRKTPTPLARLYVLRESSARSVVIRALKPGPALTAMVRNTFNTTDSTSGRLRTHFETMTGLISAVPVKSLSYAHDFRTLRAVRDAVVRDLEQ